MTKRLLVLLTLCFAFLFLLTNPLLAGKCGNGVCNNGEEESCPPDCAGGGGGGGDEDTPVCVTFTNGPTDLVESDFSPEYCDGDQFGVKATIFAKGGAFKLDTAGGKSSGRDVIVNFPLCGDLLGVDCSTEALLITRNGYFPREDPSDPLVSTGERVSLLDLNENGESRLADFQINFPSELSKSTPNVIVFGGSSADPCGLPLTVERINSDEWKIRTSDDATIEEACLWKVAGKNGKREFQEEEDGDRDFSLPFEIKITKKP